MRIPVLSFFLGLWLCLTGSAGLSLAAVSIDAPSKVSRGDAFLLTLRSDTAAQSFRVTWLGKTHVVQARHEDGSFTGRILLPVGLDEKAKKLRLTVSAQGTASSGGNKARAEQAAKNAEASHVVTVYSKKRPVSSLKVDRKYVAPPAEVQEKIKADRAAVRRALATTVPEVYWTLPLRRPLPGTVSSVFGVQRKFNGKTRSVHRGLDLRGPTGKPILACADGLVVLAEHLYYAGNAVYINHGGGVFSASMHMSKILVQPGQMVRRGDVIGLVGATGRVTGPHLHLGLHVQGQLVDPLPWLATTYEAPSAAGVH